MNSLLRVFLVGVLPCLACLYGSDQAIVRSPVSGYPVGWCIRAKPDVFAEAKKIGYEFVELALQDVYALSEEEFTQLRTALAASGLRALSGYNPFPRDLKIIGPEVDQAKLDAHLQTLLARAAALKLTYLIFNSGPNWRVPEGAAKEEAFAQLTTFARHFAEEAGKRGITVLVEQLRTSDSNQIITVAEALKLVETVNHPRFGLMIDYSFLRIQKEDPAALLKAGRHLRHVHMANPDVNPRAYPLSASESDYASFFAVLKKIGYRGGLSVHAGTKDAAAEGPRAIAFLRSQAAELAK